MKIPSVLTTPSKLRTILAMVGIVLVAASAGYLLHSITTKPRTVTREVKVVVTKEVERHEATTTSSEKKVDAEKKSTLDAKTIVDTTVNKKVVTKTTKTDVTHDPTTGKVTNEHTEVTEVTETSGEQTKTDTTTVTNNTETTKTDDKTTATTDVTEKDKETSTTTEKTVDKTGEDEVSRFGIAVNQGLKPMATYDVVRISRFTVAGAAEIDIHKKTVSGLGGAVLTDVDHGHKFVGVYVERKLQEKSTEIGVLGGIRF